MRFYYLYIRKIYTQNKSTLRGTGRVGRVVVRKKYWYLIKIEKQNIIGMTQKNLIFKYIMYTYVHVVFRVEKK